MYQEIHRHDSDANSSLCLLLTGTFFQHHFSAAVTLGIDPERPHSLVFDVDVADRCRAHVATLAATYTVRLDSGALKDASPQAITWEALGPDEHRLELLAIAPSYAGPGRSRAKRDARAGLGLHRSWELYTSAPLPLALDKQLRFDAVDGITTLCVEEFQWAG